MNRLAYLFLLCIPSVAFAETAERMQSACKGVVEARIVDDDTIALPSDAETGECWGAFGVIQTVTRVVSPSKTLIFGVCAPVGTSRSQHVKIFFDYASKHPEVLSKDFFFVAIDALKAVFPCR